MTKMYAQKRKGSILVFSLIILSMMTVVALGMAGVTLVERRGANVTSQSASAFQNADKGMEVFLQEIYKNLSALDDLSDMANALGYICVDGRIKPPASAVGEFEIVSYTQPAEGVPVGEEIEDCNVQLADVGQFKVIGEYRDAVRALRLTMRESIDRDLTSHSAFEDNAESMRFFGVPGSPTTKDYSRNAHIMTLCPMEHGVNFGTTVPFDVCPLDDENNNYAMDHVRAWVGGIVDESASASEGLDHTEALEFNGTSNYLAINTESQSAANYAAEDDLKFVDALTISMWVKRNDLNGLQMLVTKFDEQQPNARGDGYEVFINNRDEVVFQIWNGTYRRAVRSNSINDNEWHHIVATWDKDHGEDKRLHLFVDGNEQSSGQFTRSIAIADVPFMVGGRYNGGTPFDPDEFQYGFSGVIDDLRIYDRGVTDSEVQKLCDLAIDQNGSSPGSGFCGQ